MLLFAKTVAVLAVIGGIGALAHYTGHGAAAKRWAEAQVGIQTINVSTPGSGLRDVDSLRVVGDQWTYINDVIGIANAASRAGVSLRTGEAMVTAGVPPLLAQAVEEEPRFELRMQKVNLSTSWGRQLRIAEIVSLRRQAEIAKATLRKLREEPKRPFMAMVFFGSQIETVRKSASATLARLVSTAPADTRADIARVLSGRP